MVDYCNDIAKKCNFEHLNFECKTIETYTEKRIDILIALHACDTATDDAIYKGMASKAEIIVTAPQALWCSQRCKDIRDFAKKEHYQTYVNGFNGDITVTSYNNKYIITTEKSPKELCKEGQ